MTTPWIDAPLNLSPMLQNASAAALEIGWQASCLALVVLLTVTLARRASAPLRYGLLLVALVKFALPAIPAPAGIFPWLGDRLAFPTSPGPMAELGPKVSQAVMPSTAAALPISPSEPSTAWTDALVVAYLSVTLLLLLRLLWQRRRLSLWAARARPCDDPAMLQLYDRLCRRLELRRRPRLLTCEQPSAPVAFGLWTPTILIPKSLIDGLDRPALTAVLGHELAHHKRGDLWVHTLQHLLAAVWWLNPLYHWLDRALCRTREQCCDDLVLARGLVDAQAYCRALVDSAELCAGVPRVAHGLGFADRLHPMADRLTRILGRPGRRAAGLTLVSVLTVLAFAASALPGRKPAPVPEQLLLERQLVALQELQIRQLWPRYVLSQATANPMLQIEQTDFDSRVFSLEVTTLHLPAMADTVDVFGRGPATTELHSMVREGPFFRGKMSVALTEEASPPLAAPLPANEERDLLVDRLLLNEASINQTLRTIRHSLDQSPVTLNKLKPQARLERGLYSEWPMTLEIEGAPEDRLAIMDSLTRLPGLLIERIDTLSTDRLEITLRILMRPAEERLDDIDPKLERRLSPSLGHLRRLVADLDC